MRLGGGFSAVEIKVNEAENRRQSAVEEGGIKPDRRGDSRDHWGQKTDETVCQSRLEGKKMMTAANTTQQIMTTK
jgi:hypothetical protein